MIAACSARGPVSIAQPVPAISSASPTAFELDLRLRERRAAFSRFRGQARLTYESGSEKGRASQMVVVEEPDRVRIDFMSPFGPTYTVAADGVVLVAYDRGEKVLSSGSPSAANVYRYPRVPATIPLLASLIRGLPPEPDRLGQATVREEADGWHWVAALRGGGLLTVVFEKGSLEPRAVSVIGSAGAGDLTARFDDYEDVEGVSAPHLVRATLPGGGEVELKYSRIWRDVGLTDDAFTIEAPEGVRAVDMDQARNSQGG
jgi:outer membrane lipoprotein-sorting protein